MCKKSLIYKVLFVFLILMKTLSAEIRKEILSNGIVFIHKYNPEIPVVGVTIFLKMGAIYEPKKLSGISNLLQSVILKGTKNRSAEQIAEEIESIGGSISAESTYDYSVLSSAAGKQHFEKIVDILQDVFHNPTFPKKEIEKEKVNIIAEIISRKDNIFNVAVDTLLSTMYRDHPYGRLEEGNIKILKRLSQKDIISWWGKFYGIDKKNQNIVIVVSGDIEFNFAKEVIEKHFSSTRSIELPNPAGGKEIKLKNKVVKKKVHFKQGYLMYGYFAPELNKDKIKDFLVLKLLNLYFGGGMSGKLFEILREEKSLGYETNCFYPTRLLKSHFVVYLGLDADRIAIAKNSIDQLFTDLKEGKIFTEKELNETKQKFKGKYLLAHQTVLQQGWYLGFWEIMGLGWEYDMKYIDDIYAITIDDVKDVINKIFCFQDRVIVELSPKY